MQSGTWNDPALTIALALAAGMIAHAVARHVKVPGIVLLLATGVLLGPDVLDGRPALHHLPRPGGPAPGAPPHGAQQPYLIAAF